MLAGLIRFWAGITLTLTGQMKYFDRIITLLSM
jgi:hypothetical protein